MSSMSFEHILPVLTLLLGWFLNSLTPVFQERRDNRKALNKAIADLLEIRHDLWARQLAMEQIKRLGSINATEERIVWSIISKVMPMTSDLSKRYDEAVTLISSYDPLLGFQLRSKDYISKVGGLLSQIEASAGEPIQSLMELETQIYRAAIPHLNVVICDLAWHRGILSGCRIRRYVKREVEVPKEAENLVDVLKAEIERAKTGETKMTQSQSNLGNQTAQ